MLRANSYLDLLFHLLIILALLVALVMGFFYFYLPSATHHGESISVPDMVDVSLDEASQSLQARSLDYRVVDSIYDADRPPHTVVLQNPQPGSEVKEGRKVYLTVTMANPPDVEMPNLLNRSLENARAELSNKELRLGEVDYVPDLQENAVLKQRYRGRPIEAGASIPKGSRIDLTVADGRGRQNFQLPKLVDKPLDEVKFELAGIGLQLGQITTVTGSDAPPGTVMRQQPRAGRDVRVGDIVDLWVAEGGLPPDDAP